MGKDKNGIKKEKGHAVNKNRTETETEERKQKMKESGKGNIGTNKTEKVKRG